jgi:hypothetical protein
MRIVVRRVLVGSIPVVAAAGLMEASIGDPAADTRPAVGTESSPLGVHDTIAPGGWMGEDLEAFESEVEYVARVPETLVLRGGVTVALMPSTEVDGLVDHGPGERRPDELGPDEHGPVDRGLRDDGFGDSAPGHTGQRSLDAVHAALEAGWRVTARGAGVRRGDRFTAVRVTLEAQVAGFDSGVRIVDPDSGGLILDDGSFVRLADGTDVTDPDGAPLTDLAQIEASLAASGPMHATGVGYVLSGAEDGDGPLSYEALRISFTPDSR